MSTVLSRYIGRSLFLEWPVSGKTLVIVAALPNLLTLRRELVYGRNDKLEQSRSSVARLEIEGTG